MESKHYHYRIIKKTDPDGDETFYVKRKLKSGWFGGYFNDWCYVSDARDSTFRKQKHHCLEWAEKTIEININWDYHDWCRQNQTEEIIKR